MHNFKDQTAIVTGGTRGIGRGITEALLNTGATVIATYTSNDDAANMFKSELGNVAERLFLKKFDVSNPEQVTTFWNEVNSDFSSIEILINNSGIRRDHLSPVMPDEDWARVIDVNLSGSFYMAKHAINHFLGHRYGRIINMSSVGGSLGLPGQANYAASKAGQIAMSRSMAKEVGKKGITVNNVCPGFIDTELLADLPAEQIKEYKRQVPMRRFGKVSDVANAVLFLASKESSYITGTALEVTGGL